MPRSSSRKRGGKALLKVHTLRIWAQSMARLESSFT